MSEDKRIIYHGMCHSCITDQSLCVKCQGYRADWTLPDLSGRYDSPAQQDPPRTPTVSEALMMRDLSHKKHYQTIDEPSARLTTRELVKANIFLSSAIVVILILMRLI